MSSCLSRRERVPEGRVRVDEFRDSRGCRECADPHPAWRPPSPRRESEDQETKRMFPDRRQRSFLDHAVLSRLASFPLFARRPMLGTVSGRHPSPHRGSSVEFAEYRKYVPGDDLRRLDWRAYGRSDRFFVKEFEADTNLRCCLVLDTSGSMDFGSEGITKIEYARKICGVLAQLALQQGDAVGLSCVAKGIVRNIPPRRNPAHLATVFDVLEQTQPKGETQLAPVLHELAETVRQRALCMII